MNRKTFEKIKKKRIECIRSAIDKLQNNQNIEEVKRDLEWAEISSRLLAARSRNMWLLPVIFLFLITVGLTFHIPSSQISYELETENISITLDKDWSANTYHFKPISDKFFINNLISVDMSGRNLLKSRHEGESFAMELNGSNISLNELILLADSKIEVNIQDDMLKLYVRNSRIGGELFANRAVIVAENGKGDKIFENQVDTNIPETVEFRSHETSMEPVRFEFIGKNDWKLRGFQVKEIDFLEEYPPDTGIFESAVRSGIFTISESGITGNLRETDNLILKGVKTERLDISKTAGGVKVSFEGCVKEIRIGPKGREKNLTPTLLTYIYHEKLLAFLWAAVVILMGSKLRDALFNAGFFPGS